MNNPNMKLRNNFMYNSTKNKAFINRLNKSVKVYSLKIINHY